MACLSRVQCHRTFNLFDALKIVSSLAMQRESISVSGIMNAMLEKLESLHASNLSSVLFVSGCSPG